jgi:hypothetical protein
MLTVGEAAPLELAKGSRRWIVKPVLASSSLVSHPKWKVPLNGRQAVLKTVVG